MAAELPNQIRPRRIHFSRAIVAICLLWWIPLGFAQAACSGGCTTTSVGSDTVVTFLSDGTFTPPSGVTQVEYLVVGGGGGGGGLPDGGNYGGAGGGGSGAVEQGTLNVTPGDQLNVTVGAGGSGGVGGSASAANGASSQFATITSLGGGAGASGGISNTGSDGAAGGGGRVYGGGGNGTAGGDGGAGEIGAGGGGGALGDGEPGDNETGGDGGTGVDSDMTGSTITYGNGGDGGNYDDGFGSSRSDGASATANTGDGGAGAVGNNGGSDVDGGAGGSGIVVLRYTPPPITLTANALTVAVGDTLTLTVEAAGCSGVNADRWRDTWTDNGGLGVPNSGQQSRTVDSPCDSQRSRSFTVAAAPGTYTVEFESEWCRDGSAGSNTFECPANQAGATQFATFGTDTVEIEVVPASGATTLLEYRMEEDAWDGTTGGVSDASGNGNDGTARNGATTSRTDPSPAIPGDPGTCRYGEFDGTDDYIEIPGFDDLEDSFTITGWFRTRDNSQTGQRIFADDENNNDGYAVSLGDGGTGRIRFYHRALNPIILDTPGIIQNDTWYFVGAVLDEAAQEKHIYVYDAAGNLVDHTQGGFSGTLQTDGGTASVGGETDAGETGNRFNGQLDEIRVFDAALGEAAIEDAASNTRPCPPAGLTCTAREFDDALGSEWDTESVSGSFGQPRVVDGALRLTDATGNVSTRATILNAIPWDNNRVEVEFRYFAYGGSSAIGDGGDADGIAVAFSDADVTPAAGGFGGSLGYAQLDSPQTDGFAGGWLGIGIDEFGNYSNPTEGRQGGPGFIPDAVAIRGDAAGGYEYIDGTGALNPALSSPTVEDRSSLDGDLYRIVVDTTEAGTALVQIERDTTGTGDNYQLLLEEDVADDQTTAPPEEVYLSFTGSTGGSTNVHEMDFLQVCANRGLGTTVDRYVVSAPGTALTCVSSAVSIEARDANDNPVSPDAGTTLNLSTDTGKGTWSRVRSGTGTLTDSNSGDGDGNYEFPGSESSTDLSFDYPDIASDPESVTITVDDGSASGSSAPIEVSLAGFRFLDDDTSTAPDVISSQIAGKPSDVGFGGSTIELQALRARDNDPRTCDGVYDDGDTVTVEMGAECRNPALCAIDDAWVNETPVTASDDNADPGEAANYDPVEVTFGADSKAALRVRYDDAGAIRLYAHDEIVFDDAAQTPSGQFLSGTSNDFVVRPFGFHLDFDPEGNGSFDDRRSAPACGDQISCAAVAGDDRFATAGVAFPVRIGAVVWASGDDDSPTDGVPDSNQAIGDNALTPNFGQEDTPETIDIDRTLVAPAPPDGDSGNFTGGDAIAVPADAAEPGAVVANGLVWDEVGILDLTAALSDGSYLTSGNVTGRAPNVGRFIPARLEAMGNTPDFEPFCEDFTYLDQSFGYRTDPTVTVAAYSAGGSVTRNYGAGFWKLSVPTARDYTDVSDKSAMLTVVNAGTIAWNDGGNDGLSGEGSDTAPITGERLTYGRNGLEEPFDAAVDLRIPADDLTDADGVCAPDAVPADGVCNNGGGDTGADLVFDGDGDAGQQPIGGTQLRFGRLRVEDAYGPEVAPVAQRWQLDYWTGTTWARNGADTCTTLALADDVHLDPDANPGSGNEVDGTQDVDLSSGEGTTSITQPTPDVESGSILFTGGVADVLYEAPGAGKRGWIETRALLASDFPHLLADTDGDGFFDDKPSARVTFGIFAGDSEQIYLREVFPAP